MGFFIQALAVFLSAGVAVAVVPFCVIAQKVSIEVAIGYLIALGLAIIGAAWWAA